MRRMQNRCLWLAGLFVFTICTPAVAQIGSLTVTIQDADSLETLPGVTLQLSNTNQLVAPTAALTDRNGVAQFPVLRAGGGYVLEISTPGYARQRIPDIRVKSGQILVFRQDQGADLFPTKGQTTGNGGAQNNRPKAIATAAVLPKGGAKCFTAFR